jgi:hypothetical protein
MFLLASMKETQASADLNSSRETHLLRSQGEQNCFRPIGAFSNLTIIQ